MKAIIKISLVSLISSGLTFMFLISFYSPEKLDVEAETIPIVPMNFASNYETINAAPTDFILAANKSIGAVVHIKNTANGSSDNYLDYFFGEDRKARVGTGSGVIVSPDGYVLTNNLTK